MHIKDNTYFITGASRGIGRAIALQLAAAGANIVLASKSVTENEQLGGTIYSVAEEIEALGVKALPIPCDIRDEAQIIHAMELAGQTFGHLNGLINNASAINLMNTAQLRSKGYDLMMDINVRGTYLVTKHALPLLEKATQGAHIITMSPPLNFDLKWFKDHVAYTLSKYNMTMMTMAWSEEFKAKNIAANSLWPMTTIATAAVNNLLGGEQLMRKSRTPAIIADAVHFILQQDVTYTGQQLLDEAVLTQAGITDWAGYAVDPSQQLFKDLFL